MRCGKGGKQRLVTRLLFPEMLQRVPHQGEWVFGPLNSPQQRRAWTRLVQRQIAAARDALGIDGGTGRNMHSFRKVTRTW